MIKYKLFFIIILISFIFSFISSNLPNKDELCFIWPLSNNYISSYFGYRNLGGFHFHNGIDLPGKIGTEIYSIEDGIVEFAKFNGAYGYTVVIKHNDEYKSMYCHLDSNFNCKEGNFIKKEEILGFIGPAKLPSNSKVYYLFKGVKSNGMTTGPHLHFSIIKNGKYINPLDLKYN